MVVPYTSISSRTASSKQAFGSPCRSAARVAADWLCLAAAPTFAIMALLTASGSGQQDMLCAAMQHASPLGGMASMYLLMSAFHLRPWLKLIFRPKSGAHRSLHAGLYRERRQQNPFRPRTSIA
jgi:hypothetical protein